MRIRVPVDADGNVLLLATGKARVFQIQLAKSYSHFQGTPAIRAEMEVVIRMYTTESAILHTVGS